MAVLDAYSVSYEKRNIQDEDALYELMQLGGKKQTPFLVDGDTMMYESQSIQDYIEKKCSGDVCDTRKIHFSRET